MYVDVTFYLTLIIGEVEHDILTGRHTHLSILNANHQVFATTGGGGGGGGETEVDPVVTTRGTLTGRVYLLGCVTVWLNPGLGVKSIFQMSLLERQHIYPGFDFIDWIISLMP